MPAKDLSALPLRERKKVLTRRAIVDAAERLFEQRGFDEVTVAEVAAAANVSVKTLFVYFRSKQDLAFADTALFDSLLDALRCRARGTTHAEAIVAAMINAARTLDDEGFEGFHRGYGASPALRSGLLRMWADFEDQLTEFLAAESGREANPGTRLHAMQLAAIVRLATSAEMRSAAADRAAGSAAEELHRWMRAAATTISPLHTASPTYGVPA